MILWTLPAPPLTQQMLVNVLRPPGLEESFAKMMGLPLDPPTQQEYAEQFFASPLGSLVITVQLTPMPEMSPQSLEDMTCVAGI